MTRKYILTLFITLWSFSSFAGVSDDMDEFFKSAGVQSNITGAGAYQGQTAGLYTGGQVYARTRVQNIYPGNIRLPSYSAGCGGIDAFTGSFSFINGDELKNSLQNIASSSVNYAFMIAMETLSPQISGVQKYLSNLANVVNQANINSCEAAAGLVGGLWPKTQVAQNQICSAAGASGGILSDWAAAKQGCKNGGTTSRLSAEANKEWGALITQNKNVAWEAIKQNKFLSMDTEMKELLMSISGTYIIKNGSNDNSGNDFGFKKSLAGDSTLIRALLSGGETTIYKCDEPDLCLNPIDEKIRISADKSFEKMVLKTINSIKDAILVDRKLTEEEVKFLGSTSLPLYKILNVEYAVGKGAGLMNVEQYSSMIAADILYQYLSENLEIMTFAAEKLQLMDDLMKKYKEGLALARSNLNHQRYEAKSTMNETLNLIKQTQQLEQVLAGRLSSHLVNVIGFENGV